VNAIHLAADFIDKVRRRQAAIERGGAHDPAYEVPHTTLHVGVIRGGTVLNIVPSLCEVELEIRNIAADDPGLIVDGMRADAAEIGGPAEAHTGIDLEVMHEYPGLETPYDSELVALVAELTGHREPVKVGYGSEGGLFSGRLAIPTVVCGPGSIDQAHRPDEFVDSDQLLRCDAMLEALLDRLN
jgi:acetylornithine deacetylase